MQKLIKQLREIFKDDDINTEDVKRVLDEYKSNPSDWKKYAKSDPYKYTRNLVDIGNGKYNLLILVWPPGIGSAIHDHTNSHCFVKILAGNLKETLYNWPNNTDDEPHGMVKTNESIYNINEVTYMSDELGLHRMENSSHSDLCVSLHLYIPPFKTCRIFDERTGKESVSTVTFYTKYGKKVDYTGSSQGKLIPFPANDDSE